MEFVTFALILVFVSSCIAAERKNVLLIIVDDLRPELGCYSGDNAPTKVHPPMSTPYIDALAAESLLLTQTYTQQAVCNPSRTSFMTSRRPTTTQVYDLERNFRDEDETKNFKTLAQHFKDNGYKSHGFGKIFHKYEDTESWDSYDSAKKNGWENTDDSWKAIPDADLSSKPLVDKQLADKAIEKLGSFSENENFFMAVGFHKPHLPFVFPSSYLEKYNADIQLPDNPYTPTNMPRTAWNSYGELRKYGDISSYTGRFNTTLDDTKVKELRKAYYCSVSWVDTQVGAVLEKLNTTSFKDNTVIALISDHGFQLGEHAEWVKQTNFQLATRVAAMLRVPGKTDGGKESDKLTELVDIFPTLVEAAGLDAISKCPSHNSADTALCTEGDSMMPLITETNPSWKTAAFSQFPRSTAKKGDYMGYSVKTKRYRYTDWVPFDYTTNTADWTASLSGGKELYDHEIDPDENVNRVDETDYSAVVTELSKIVQDGWTQVSKTYEDLEPTTRQVGREVKLLKSLARRRKLKMSHRRNVLRYLLKLIETHGNY